MDYLDYAEIRNAIEVLGGSISIDRNITGDKYYEAMKSVE
jgi:hypothetical protein